MRMKFRNYLIVIPLLFVILIHIIHFNYDRLANSNYINNNDIEINNGVLVNMSSPFIILTHLKKSGGTSIIQLANRNQLNFYQPNKNGRPCYRNGTTIPFWLWEKEKMLNWFVQLKQKGINFIAIESKVIPNHIRFGHSANSYNNSWANSISTSNNNSNSNSVSNSDSRALTQAVTNSNNRLNIVEILVIRHPIERSLSHFFYRSCHSTLPIVNRLRAVWDLIYHLPSRPLKQQHLAIDIHSRNNYDYYLMSDKLVEYNSRVLAGIHSKRKSDNNNEIMSINSTEHNATDSITNQRIVYQNQISLAKEAITRFNFIFVLNSPTYDKKSGFEYDSKAKKRFNELVLWKVNTIPYTNRRTDCNREQLLKYWNSNWKNKLYHQHRTEVEFFNYVRNYSRILINNV